MVVLAAGYPRKSLLVIVLNPVNLAARLVAFRVVSACAELVCVAVFNAGFKGSGRTAPIGAGAVAVVPLSHGLGVPI